MYIEPNTDIYILKDVPLDTTYDHTIWFANVSDQTNYFISKRKYSLSDYSYQRVRRGYMRVGINANNLYDCNYLMFRNTNFGSKWFYAYIKSVEYVNNDVSEIEFEIDVMQTWFFDYDLDECFVEREHSATDNIGDNIVPESVELGEYLHNYVSASTSGHLYGYQKIFPFDDINAVLIQYVSVDSQSGGADGRIVDGIYSGAKYEGVTCRNSNDAIGINGIIQSFISDPDAIVNMYMCPSCFLKYNLEQDPSYNENNVYYYNIPLAKKKGITYKSGATQDDTTNTYPFPDVFSPLTGIETLDGYTPHNKKLYTYPYNFLSIDNSNGDNISLRYEFFENANGERDGIPKFVIFTTYTAPPRAILMPISYKGSGGGVPDYSQQISLDEYPVCSWNADYYDVWLAQNLKPSVINAVGNLAGGSMLSTPVGTKNAIESASNSLANAYKASIVADISKGNFNNSQVLFSNSEYGIRAGRMSINKNNAQIIDQFFDRFGYATNLLKVPNTHARARWCYTKTVACTISGSIPSDDARRICEIYNNGITFWKNGQTVCDYSNPETNIPNGEVGD